MGRCGKPFCTCCETAYADGFCDGYKNGFSAGYTRGHRAGYVHGYLDGATDTPPLPIYEPLIKSLLPDPLRLSCGCYGTCTCPRLLATIEPPLLTVRLGCGCYGTCLGHHKRAITPPVTPVRLRCGCYYACTCKIQW